MARFEVYVVKIEDDLEHQEIGRLVLTGVPTDWAPDTLEDYTYHIDEGSHPKVPRPLRGRGKVIQYPVRQTVWALIHAVVGMAIRDRLCQ